MKQNSFSHESTFFLTSHESTFFLTKEIKVKKGLLKKTMTTYIRDDVQIIDGREVNIAIYRCNGCGREWDGNAQCYPCVEEEEEEEDEVEDEKVMSEVAKRKAELTSNIIEVPRPLKRSKVLILVTGSAEACINEILDTLHPNEAEALSAEIAILRTIGDK